jgi:hypothetical protein
MVRGRRHQLVRQGSLSTGHGPAIRNQTLGGPESGSGSAASNASLPRRVSRGGS